MLGRKHTIATIGMMEAAPLRELAGFRQNNGGRQPPISTQPRAHDAASNQFNPNLYGQKGKKPNLANKYARRGVRRCTIHHASGLGGLARQVEHQASSLRGPTAKRLAPHPGHIF